MPAAESWPSSRSAFRWATGPGPRRTMIMGVLNITPDAVYNERVTLDG